jgi:hypothetical protein
VFESNTREIIFFTASRGHHADIGGILPGSMPPTSVNIFEEGAEIVSFKIVDEGIFNREGLVEHMVDKPSQYPGSSGCRNIRDVESDLKAVRTFNCIASFRQSSGSSKSQPIIRECSSSTRVRLFTVLVKPYCERIFCLVTEDYGLKTVQEYMYHIRANAEMSVRNLLRDVVRRAGSNILTSVDYLDDGSPVRCYPSCPMVNFLAFVFSCRYALESKSMNPMVLPSLTLLGQAVKSEEILILQFRLCILPLYTACGRCSISTYLSMRVVWFLSTVRSPQLISVPFLMSEIQ